MSTLTIDHRVLAETAAGRDEASSLLQTLQDAKRCSERNLADIGRVDLVKQVTGQSALDAAIESARSMVASFDRVLDDLRSNLDADDLALLDEVRRDPGLR